MALDWDNIIIETDEYSYSLDAEQRMILFAGNKGDKGDPGDPGEAATITVGTVTTLAAGSPATVENVGTPQAARFNFGIPQGPQGDPGSSGGGAWGEITGTLSDQTDLQDALDAKQNTLTFDSTPTDGSSNPVTSDGIYDALATKQSTLTFDSAPTDGSNNPVTSNGVYDALAGKQDTLTFDTTPTASSTNPVTSGGIKTALDAKQNTLSWDTAPTSGGTNPMTSGAIYAHEPFQVTGNASAGSSVTFTDSRIDSDHWRIPKGGIYFGTGANVTTDVHWVTNPTNHTVTLEATFSGATTVAIDMIWFQ